MAKEDEVLSFFEELEEEDEKLKSYVKMYESLSQYLVDFNLLKDSNKITQKEIAQKMGTTQSAISRIESLKTNPSYKQLVKMSEAVGGKLLITPMADMTIQVPYDLQSTVRELAISQKLSVQECLLNLLRSKIENDTQTWRVNISRSNEICKNENYKDVFKNENKIVTENTKNIINTDFAA